MLRKVSNFLKNYILTIILASTFLLAFKINAKTKNIPKNSASKNNIENIRQNEKKYNTYAIIDNILNYIKSIITIIGLGLGIYYGFPLLRKKLQEDHIKNLVNQIQKKNKFIHSRCHNLIEKHYSKLYKNLPVDYNEIQNIYFELKELDSKAYDSNKEIATLSFLLKNTIQGILRYYDSKRSITITTRELYSFYINTLSLIVFFATKVVSLPKRASTEKFKMINKKIDKFLTSNTFRKYKYFEIGVEHDYTSPIVLLFFHQVNQSSNCLFRRAAYKILDSNEPIARFLYLSNLYFPVILQSSEKFPLFHVHPTLKLIGFDKMNTSTSKGTKETVDLYYANLDDVFHFVRNKINKKNLIDNYNDKYLNLEKTKLGKINSFGKYHPEIVKINVDLQCPKKLFRENKRKLKNKMKSEI